MTSYHASKILEGATFKEFAISCFGAFPALSGHEDLDEAAFDTSELSKNHAEKMKELNAEKETILAMSDEQITQKAKQEHEYTLKAHKEQLTKELADNEKYNNMLAQVEAYEPPTGNYIYLKDEMKSKIQENITSISSLESTENYIEELTAKGPLSVSEWREKEIASVDRSITRQIEENREEIERLENSKLWIQQFKASLENPPVPA